MGKAVRKSARRSPQSKRPKQRVQRSAKKKRPVNTAGPSYRNEFFAVLLFSVGLFVFVALVSFLRSSDPLTEANVFGALGAFSAQQLSGLFGWSALVVPLMFCFAGREVWNSIEGENQIRPLTIVKAITCSLLLLVCIATAGAVAGGVTVGGVIGSGFADILVTYVNAVGALLLSTLGILLMLIALTNLTFASIFSILAKTIELISGAGQALFSGLATGVVATITLVRNCCTAVWQSTREDYEQIKSAKEPSQAQPRKRFVLGTEEDDDTEAEDDSYDADEEIDEDDEDEDEYDEDDEDEFDEEEEYEDELDDDDLEPPLAEVKIWRREVVERSTGKSAKLVAESRPRSNPDYERPSLDLLVGSESSANTGPDDELLIENSRLLEESLKNFRIGGRVVEVHPGPVVTLYQFAPAPGVKVQRIINLADDLALALKVASVRVYAPVPGKGTVGVEVPNKQREIVRLRDILESGEFSSDQNPLPLALGKDTYGEPYVAHLPRMPHLLIAGATGTGKSVCINSLLLSLLCRNTPDELNLIMIDPKMLELSIYEDIPHLKAPVVTNAKRARGVLWWAVEEMERRYRLLKRYGVRDIAAYNKLCAEPESARKALKTPRKNVTIQLSERDVIATGSPYEGLDRTADEDAITSTENAQMERLPRIVVVVDELADLMLTVGREIEDLLARLAQKARAAGIHLILATQRPSVNVITGLIKANFPARISFKVASKIDARTVLDTSGAEKLLGQGDMLFLAPWVGQVKRLHSPYVSDQEVHDVCNWLRTQGEPLYDTAIEAMINKIEESEGGADSSGGLTGDGQEYDEFYDRAVSLVVEKGHASTSMVQRAFRIGYNRAARILETMEREGIVGPADGAKPRQVLIGAVDGPI